MLWGDASGTGKRLVYALGRLAPPRPGRPEAWDPTNEEKEPWPVRLPRTQILMGAGLQRAPISHSVASTSRSPCRELADILGRGRSDRVHPETGWNLTAILSRTRRKEARLQDADHKVNMVPHRIPCEKLCGELSPDCPDSGTGVNLMAGSFTHISRLLFPRRG